MEQLIQTGFWQDEVIGNDAVPGVYFGYSSTTKLIKIGFSVDIARRKMEYVTENPEPIRWLMYIQTPQYRKVEQSIHARFAPQRQRGEWFRLKKTQLFKIATEYRCDFWDQKLKDEYAAWIKQRRSLRVVDADFLDAFREARKRLKDPYNSYQVWNLFCNMAFKDGD